MRRNNTRLASEFAAMARDMKCTPSQLALAWLLSKGENVIPIPGTRHVSHLEDNAGAVNLDLSESDVMAIESLAARFPDVGSRYPENLDKLTNK